MRELTTPAQRLSFLIDKILNINLLQFSKKVGIGYIYLSQMRNNHKPFTKAVAFKIGLAFPKINADWIFTGEGEAMKGANSNHPTHADLPQQVNEPSAEYMPGKRISYDDMPDLIRHILNEVQDLRARVEALEKEVENVKNERIKSAE